MKTLRDIRVGDDAEVVRVMGDGALQRRIMDMGLTKGCRVHVHKAAPLGDPIEINLRGYSLSLRKQDAANIEVR